MESIQFRQRAEFKNYPKRMIDRSPASPTFVQRKFESNMYENVLPCQELCASVPISNNVGTSSVTLSNYASVCHAPKKFSSANERPVSPESVDSQRSIPAFGGGAINSYCNIKGSHVHQMSGSLSSNSLGRYDVGELSSQFKQRLPLPSCPPANYVNSNSNFQTEEDRDTSPIFRNTSAIGLKPRSNTAPSRRRPLLSNALRCTADASNGVRVNGCDNIHHLQQPSIQCSCEAISNSHFVVQGAEGRENINRLVASHSPQTSSLPGSPKNLPRRTSLPGSWKSERSPMNARNSSKGSTSVQFCPSCAQIAATLPTGWEVKETNEGLPYFIDHNTRSTHWRLPWLPACLPCDLLQKAYLENSSEVVRDGLLSEENALGSNSGIVRGASYEMHSAAVNDYNSTNSACGGPPPEAGAPAVPPRQPIMSSKRSTNRIYSNERQPELQELQKVSSSPPLRKTLRGTLRERLYCDSRQMNSNFRQTSNYNLQEAVTAPHLCYMPFSASSVGGFADHSSGGSYERNDPGIINDSVAFEQNYIKLNRELKPLTRLPNALPLDVAVAAERSRRVIDTYKPELASPESPQAPKRPEHPSVESQLVYLLNAQPDFFMDAYYKGDEKLDRMIDFKLFDCGQLEVMRDSMDKLYFAECQSTCAAYERYRVALTEKIKHKLGLQLKEKHKRQLNHIRNCAANASASSRSSSNEGLDDDSPEVAQNTFQQHQQNDDVASL